MIVNYIIFAIRLFRRDKFHSILNIIGLSTGLACSIIILLYLQNELTYDRYHKNADRIYRAALKYTYTGQTTRWASSSPALGKRLKDEFPEIEEIVRIVPSPKILFKTGETTFYENHIFMADPSVFKIFTHNFIYGDTDTSLNDPMSIVLTETLARKYFENRNPTGQLIQVEGADLKITGIIEDLPPNSHLPIRALISFSTLSALYPDQNYLNWSLGDFLGYTYFLVNETFVLDELMEKAREFIQKNHPPLPESYDVEFEPIAQKLTDIHYGPYMRFDYPIGNKAYIYAFFSIGIFILVLACINYMNMATARAAIRAKEIGIKKVLGSEKWQLTIQLLMESFLASFIALIIAFGLVELITALPMFKHVLNVELKFDLLNNHLLVFGTLGLFIFVGLLSGIYPAFYLSSILYVRALSNTHKSRKAGIFVRRSLVTFQFIISIAVIIVTLFMGDQIEFLRNKSLGFKKENVVSIDIRNDTVKNKLPALMENLRSHQDIISVTIAHSKPGKEASAALYEFEGPDGMKAHNFYHYWVSHDYLSTLGIKLIKGRDFNKNYPSDLSKAVIVNEKLVKALGWDHPLGKRVIRRLPDEVIFSGEVVGVVKDFNFRSLHNEIEPMFIRMQQNVGGSLIVRIKGVNILETMDFLKNKWKQVSPGRPFVYSFLDEDFDRLYDADRQQNQLITIFSYICILISCLGLLGLSSFNTSRRTKEIAIRKVHGASALRVIGILFIEIFFLVAVAAVIAVPISLLLIKIWLENFAYQAGINSYIFIITTMAALAIAFLTASYHCIRVARKNPVNALRYE
jgi:putative ABC transport system permease protein